MRTHETFTPEVLGALGLPDDYNEYTSGGQADCRVAIVSGRGTPEDDVASFHFFRSYYLLPQEAGWYDHWVEPAPGHYEWIWVAHQYPRVIKTAHRGSAKSQIWSKEMPLRDLVSQPGSSNFVILSSDDKIQRHTDKLMQQIDGNARIVDDFGKLRPKRTEGLWNHHTLRLRNRAMLVMGTVNSMNLRGERPWVITLDDIERDPKPGTNVEQLIQSTNNFFFQVVLPMSRGHTKVRFVGTPNNKTTLIWRLQNDGDSRIDPERWHNSQDWFFTPEGTPFWPAEYPTPESIAVKQRELGPEVWAFEMLGQEALSDGNSVLHIDPDKNEYDIDDQGAFNADEPLNCTAALSWKDSLPSSDGTPSYLPRTMQASRLFGSLYRFITVDYASTVSSTSDYSVVSVWGVDRLNQLFLLETWGERRLSDDLIAKIWEMARRWRVRVVGVEAVALQVEFYARVAERQAIMAQGGWCPQVVPIRYHGVGKGLSKPERISATRGRFRSGAIKFPRWRAKEKYHREMRAQIAGFRPNAALKQTGLGHDDFVDTVAMAQELVPGRRAATIEADPVADPIEAIRRGIKEVVGFPTGMLVPLHKMPGDCLDKLMARPTVPAGTFTDWEEGAM